jgi:hypothetical protein
MFSEERYRFQPHYVTISDVWEMYERKDTPLNADTILAILAPLAGTSFLKHATEILGSLTERQPIHALDLALMFYGAFADTLKSTDDKQQEDAIICLYHLAGFSVPLDAVHTMKYMEPDELLAREYRSDFLYDNLDKQHLAGTHRAIQFRFYKAGVYRHMLSVSMIEYQEEDRRLRIFTQLSEGMKPHRFFSDVEQPPLPFVDPRQTSFLRTSPLLFIGQQFSFEKAQPRSRS